MWESNKHRFLDSPISQAGLFDFAHQFSEAFRHILPRRSAAVSTLPPAAAPPSAHRRGRPPAASTSAPARPQQHPSQQRRSRGKTGEGRDRAGPSSRGKVTSSYPRKAVCSECVLNWALHKLLFRMLTQRRIFQCIRPFDWLHTAGRNTHAREQGLHK